MPKKIIFESAVHQFVMATRELLSELENQGNGKSGDYRRCVSTWKFEYQGPKKLRLSWTTPATGESLVEFPEAQFYTRGDVESFIARQQQRSLIGGTSDPVSDENRTYFKRLAQQVLDQAHQGRS